MPDTPSQIETHPDIDKTRVNGLKVTNNSCVSFARLQNVALLALLASGRQTISQEAAGRGQGRQWLAEHVLRAQKMRREWKS